MAWGNLGFMQQEQRENAAAALLQLELLLAPPGFSAAQGLSLNKAGSRLTLHAQRDVWCCWCGAVQPVGPTDHPPPPVAASPMQEDPQILRSGFKLSYLAGEALQLAGEDVHLAAGQQTSGEHQLL